MSVSWIVDCLSIFALCILIIGVAIPRVQLLAYRKNLLDKPAKRKVHKAPTPRLGGTTFLPTLMLSFTIVVAVNIVTRRGELLAELASESLPLASIFCALILSYILGVFDDIRGVGYHVKFIAQSISVLIIIFSGVELSGLRTLLLLASWPLWTVVPLTALAMVFIINAINLIDGIDGLASGLCILSFACYGIAFVFCSQNIYALLSFAFVGVLIPFFYYNVFGTQRKRKIFMGDTGSLTLGMMLCFLNIKLTQMPQDSLPHINKYLLAALPLMIPCFDVMRVFAYRLLHGNNPFLPDNNHIHHRLIRTGLSVRTTMVTLILSSALLTLTNVMLCNDLGVMLLLAADITLWIVINIIIDLLLKRKEKNSLIEKQSMKKRAIILNWHHSMLWIAAALLYSCSTPKDIAYFQNAKQLQGMALQAEHKFRLRPEDKISIVVNSSNPMLEQQFTLTSRGNSNNILGAETSPATVSSSGSGGSIIAYTVDEQGTIDFPVLGKIRVEGKTREEVAAYIKERLIARELVSEPIVTVEYVNMSVNVLGEVSSPGNVPITKDHFTVIDALAKSGDLTINGNRRAVMVSRNNNGVNEVHQIDLTDMQQTMLSDGYYLQQNDLVYVTPNDKRKRDSTNTGNIFHTPYIWMSIISMLASLIAIFK